MASVPTSAALLGVWESGEAASPAARGLLLLGLALPDADGEALASATIGRRDAWLLALRERLFGCDAECLADCAACGEAIEIAFDTRALRAPDAEAGHFEVSIPGGSIACRLPDSRDLLAIAGMPDVAAARALLAERCTGVAALPEAALVAIEAAMAARDPQAEILLDIACPACAAPALAPFDIVRHLWSDLDGWARAMLRKVHILASHYHWDEAAILALAPARREHYLALTGAA